MKLTIDSNLWEQITHPHKYPLPAERNERLVRVQDALKTGRVTGFISQSVMTLEGLKRADRARFMTSQTMRPKVLENFESRPVVFAPDQSGRPALMPVLSDRLRYATSLGIRVIEIPAYAELEFSGVLFAEVPENFIDVFGPIEFEIEKRGVGRAVLKNLGHELASREGGDYVYSVGALPPVKNLTPDDRKRISKAVAEAADGDAIAAHIAIGNDYFVTHDFGVSAGPSILDKANREWLAASYSAKFLSLAELAELITS